MSEFVIRSMSRPEIDLAVEWAAREGWNPGLHDADAFYAADPQGFLVGLLREEPVAVISAVRYGQDFGFVGFYIVRPDLRGQGYGFRLWQAALQHLHGRCIGLDGVVAQQDNYRHSGFELAYRNIRQQGLGGGQAPACAELRPLAEFSWAEVLRYDQDFFPAGRATFLDAWLKQPAATALGWRASGGGLAGYGMLRPCREGFKVGPLFADTPLIAEQLLRALRARVPEGGSLYFDTPEVNGEALALASRLGMRPAFETARMYVGAAPRLPLSRLFGVTSFELG